MKPLLVTWCLDPTDSVWTEAGQDMYLLPGVPRGIPCGPAETGDGDQAHPPAINYYREVAKVNETTVSKHLATNRAGL